MRAPHLYPLLRGFALGSFVLLGRELEEGAELPFAFEEHVERRGPALYELRPLVRSFIEAREAVLRTRDDARLAVEELKREPAAAIFAKAHAGKRATEDEALFRTVLLALLMATAEGCGGFDWDDESSSAAYAELEGSLFGEHRLYVAVAPLAGLSIAKREPSWRPASSFEASSRASSRRTGPSRAVCFRRASARSRIAARCSSSVASSTAASRRPTRRRSWPTR